MGNCLRSFNFRRRTREGWEFPLLIGILVLAFATRLGIAIATKSWIFSSDDNFWEFGYEMGQIASTLAMGNGFGWPEWSAHPEGPTAWMAPVYPFIMAVAFRNLGIYSSQAAIVLQLFQIILSVLTCVLLYFLGKRLYNAQVGLIAAFLLAMYPPAVHYSVRIIWDTSLFTACLILIILMFLRQAQSPDMKGGAFLGLLIGFTALVNPVVIGPFPFALTWLFLKANADRRAIIKSMSAMVIASCLVISPWLVRNYGIFGNFVPIKSNFGHELFLGNNEYATGTYEDAFGRYRKKNPMTALTAADQAYLRQSDEVSRNRFLLHKAITSIVTHPIDFLKRTMSRFVAYWTYMRPTDTWQAKVSVISYLSVLMLAIGGLFITRDRRKDVQLVLLFLLLIPVPYYLTIVGVFRYRFPIEPILMIFAGYTIQAIVSWHKRSLSQAVAQ